MSTLPSRPARPSSPLVAGARQRTLRNPIGCVGTGLHTGAKVALTLHPAEPGTGIRFLRYDRPGAVPIPARPDSLCAATPSTTVGDWSGAAVGSVEHLMAALAACELDNVLVEVGGPEVPVMDGSAQPFVFLIECAGRVEQDRPRRFIEILKPVGVAADGGSARLEPAGRAGVALEIDCAIASDHPLVGRQSLRFAFGPDRFKLEIAQARTFGFADQLEELWARGLALGGSLKNTLLLGRSRVLNAEGLRFADEFVRHRVLDCVGELYLAGAQIVGRYVGRDAGPALHAELLRRLLADPTAWRVVGDDDGVAPLPGELDRRPALSA